MPPTSLQILAPLARPAAALARGLRYRLRLLRSLDAGELNYRWNPEIPPAPSRLAALWPASTSPELATEFCRGQTLNELVARGLAMPGHEPWRIHMAGAPQDDSEAPFFYAPGAGQTPNLDPAWLETAWLMLAAEGLDAVLFRCPEKGPSQPSSPVELLSPAGRRTAVFRNGAYRYDPVRDRVIPRQGLEPLVKVLPLTEEHRTSTNWNRRHRGPYLASHDLPSRLTVDVRDAAALERHPLEGDDERPAVLVLAPFLARGGAEETLWNTLDALRHRFRFSFATLAPHRPERGDRRDDFRRISPRLFSLGDLVHPAAMPGMLLALLDATGANILYNANGTTLFYDFAPGLKAARPDLRILDHLYDHRVGYIDRYNADLLQSVDSCVAENHRIRDVLLEERGWPTERIPVIWPCGRPAGTYPEGQAASDARQRLRRELDLAEDDVVFLTAARMHPQKRPLDLVELARRVQDLEKVTFLLAGGGDLEAEVDQAIATSGGARIRRLPFREDIPELLAAADVGCLVSDYEGLPVFLLEALQVGRPFLGTDVGDLGRVLKGTSAGLVVDRPGDLDALEAAVRRLADHGLRTTLGNNARRAAPTFSVEACAERYARAFLGEEELGEMKLHSPPESAQP